MDVTNTNGQDSSLTLKTVNNEFPSITAAAIESIWTEAKLKLKEDCRFDTLSTSPNAISTPQPTPKKSMAPIIPNNAPVPTLAELSMNASISDPVILANIDTVKELMSRCGNMIPQPEDKPELFEPTGGEGGTVIATGSSNGVPEKRHINNELNLFTREVTPSILTANEEMLSEDEEMDTHSGQNSTTEPAVNSSKDSAIAQDSISSGSHHSSPDYVESDSELTSSGIVTSFNTDSYLFDPSSRECSEGVSPDKHTTLPRHVTMVPLGVASGVASFTSDNIHIPGNASSAPVDMSVQNFPKRHVHRAAVYAMHPYHRATCRGGTGVNVAKTLDLLKAVTQSSFNQEIKKLCDDYLQIYGMAAVNIHENTGDSVPTATLRLLVCKMLEEAMQGYQNNKWEFSSHQLPKNDRLSEYKGSPMSTKKSRTEKDTKQGVLGKRGRKQTEKVTDNRSAWKWSLDKRRLDPLKWSPDKLTPDTKFSLGVNVNKALGHAANRGKVYILHPQLFKYVCDGDDKTWLFENKFMPVHGGKAFLMIFDEVEDLTKSVDNYKQSNEVIQSVQNLKRFCIPEFMLTKMKDFIKHVQGFFAQETASQIQSSSEEIK